MCVLFKTPLSGLCLVKTKRGGRNGTSQFSWRAHGRISRIPIGALFHPTCASRKTTHEPRRNQLLQFLSRPLKFRFQETQSLCAATERDRPFCWCTVSRAQA